MMSVVDRFIESETRDQRVGCKVVLRSKVVLQITDAVIKE